MMLVAPSNLSTSMTDLILVAIVEGFDWTSLVTNLGFGAFVMWFAWHTQTHTIPGLLSQHREERDSTRKDFLTAIAEGRKDYLASEASQREAYLVNRTEDRMDMKRLIEAVTQLAAATQIHVTEARAVWRIRGELIETAPKKTADAI